MIKTKIINTITTNENEDETYIKFSICEKCLKKLFGEFKIKPDFYRKDYSNITSTEGKTKTDYNI